MNGNHIIIIKLIIQLIMKRITLDTIEKSQGSTFISNKK